MVSCLPSIQAGGGTGLIFIEQEKSGIPPKPPFRFSLAQTERERKQAGKNSFPPTPFLFARLLIQNGYVMWLLSPKSTLFVKPRTFANAPIFCKEINCWQFWVNRLHRSITEHKEDVLLVFFFEVIFL